MTSRARASFLSLAAAAAAAIFLGGCVGVSFQSPRSGMRDSIKGEGPMTTVEYETGDYDSVEIEGGDFELVYSSAPSGKVIVEIQENLAEYLSVAVRNGRLIVGSDTYLQTDPDDMPRITIAAPVLREIRSGGSLTIRQADTVTADSFTLDSSGACDVTLTLEVGAVNMAISGAGLANLSGRSESADISVSGAGSVEALGLETREARIELNGSGSAGISCAESLEVEISGAGSVRYKGSPRIRQDISGAGAVWQVD